MVNSVSGVPGNSPEGWGVSGAQERLQVIAQPKDPVCSISPWKMGTNDACHDHTAHSRIFCKRSSVGATGMCFGPPGPSAVSALPHKSSVAWACLLFCKAISTRGSGHRADARPGHLGSLPFPAAHTYQYSNSLHSDIRLFQFRIDLRPLSIY